MHNFTQKKYIFYMFLGMGNSFKMPDFTLVLGLPLEASKLFLYPSFLHLFWLYDLLGIKIALGGISAITALLSKMAAKELCKGGLVKIWIMEFLKWSRPCNTSKSSFWREEFISGVFSTIQTHISSKTVNFNLTANSVLRLIII